MDSPSPAPAHPGSSRRRIALLLVAALATWCGGPTAVHAAGAADDHTVLILQETVIGGAASLEATRAAAQGFTVEVVSGAVWGAKSAADFRTYRAIILGDPACTDGTGPITAAIANAGVWGAQVDGNVIVIGTDPAHPTHQGQSGIELTDKGIAFATAKPGTTGAYVALSCYYRANAPAGTALPLLDGIAAGGFKVTQVGCFNAVKVVATHPALDGLTSAELSNWNCSVHEGFTQFPPDFLVLAVAENLGSIFTAPDGTVGTPYIIARGITAVGLALAPVSATATIGTDHTVTASLASAAGGQPVVGARVALQVTSGPNTLAAPACDPADCLTNAAGQVAFTYTGSGGFGTDALLGFVDADSSATPGVGEAQTTAAVSWVASAATCQVPPPPGGGAGFDPTLEWAWTGSPVAPTFRQVIVTPAVVNLNDDDGDGQVTVNDVPDIVFPAANATDGGLCGRDVAVLRAISGKDGSPVWDVTDRLFRPCTSPAVGDLDGDGLPEIVVATGGGFAIYEHDGTFKKLTAPVSDHGDFGGAPSIADIDHDGQPEIIIGGTVLDHEGVLRFSNLDLGNAALGAISVAVDLDLAGDLEIVTGFRAFKSDGTLFYATPTLSALGGYPGIGNFDADAFPEVVVVFNGAVMLLEHTGAVKWGPISIQGGRGGPPTVADFDGDGEPEIGVAGAIRYTVFETDGTVKWQAVIQDNSSNVTGSSVFDFDDDGSAEVLYADELKFRIFRGTDGTVLFDPPNTSCTATENPIVVDVDNDGNAEVVVTFNEVCGIGNAGSGVKVFGDANDTWVRTRRIWNQHAYSITNVREDGTIPTSQVPNWLTPGLNDFRLNAFLPGEGTALDAPDLVPTLAVDHAGCPQSATVTAHVKNEGAVTVPPGLKVAFFDGDPDAGGTLLGVVETTGALAPNATEPVGRVVGGPLSPGRMIFVRVDDDGAGTGRETECREDNNEASVHVACEEEPPPPSGMCSFDARTRVRVSNDSRVEGSVSVNEKPGRAMLGRRVEMPHGTMVTADRVKIGNLSDVHHVRTNALKRGRGAVIGEFEPAPPFPLVTPFCIAPSFACDGPDVTVPRHENRTLSPGGYGKVALPNDSTLVLDPGEYRLCTLRAGRNVHIHVNGPGQTTIRIAGEVRLANQMIFDTDPGTPTPTLTVGGKLFRLGPDSRMEAAVVAPEAKVSIGRKSRFTGSFCGDTAQTGWHVVLACGATPPPTTTTTTTTTSTTTTAPSTTTRTQSTTATRPVSGRSSRSRSPSASSPS